MIEGSNRRFSFKTGDRFLAFTNDISWNEVRQKWVLTRQKHAQEFGKINKEAVSRVEVINDTPDYEGQ